MYAAAEGHADIVQLLLQLETIDANAQNSVRKLFRSIDKLLYFLYVL